MGKEEECERVCRRMDARACLSLTWRGPMTNRSTWCAAERIRECSKKIENLSTKGAKRTRLLAAARPSDGVAVGVVVAVVIGVVIGVVVGVVARAMSGTFRSLCLADWGLKIL